MTSKAPNSVLWTISLLLLAGCRTAGSFEPVRVAPVLRPQEPAPQEPATPPAEPRQPFGEKFGLRAGGFAATSFDTKATLSLEGTNLGSDLDLEDDLGMDSETDSLRIDGYLRFGRAHRLDVGYFDLERTSTKTIQEQIVWGDLTIPVNFEVGAFMDTQILQARYTYYPIRGENYELGFGGGIYGMDLAVGLSVNTLGASTEFSTPLPLPVLSVQGAWEFLPRLQLLGAAQLFYLELEGVGEIEELKGGVIDLNLGLEWNLLDNIGVGAAVNYFQLEVDSGTSGLELDLDYDYVGLFLYLAVKI